MLPYADAVLFAEILRGVHARCGCAQPLRQLEETFPEYDWATLLAPLFHADEESA